MSRSETAPLTSFDPAVARRRFAALRDAAAPIFFDNAAGAQVPDEVVAAVREHLEFRNVQRGGRYDRSRAVDAVIAAARRRIATLLNAASPDEICFGANATSVMRAVAAAIRTTLKPGDRFIVTELDHEANVGPWLRLERSGATIQWWPLRGGSEARLELEDLEALLRAGGGRVRVVALPLASNACGRIVDVAGAARLARAYGAWTFVDAVHYAPHGGVDVEALGADFCAFSGYKIFGPHIGFLWGRREILNALEPEHDFFIPAEAPYVFEGGTQNFEGMAGMSAAVHYLATLEEPAGGSGSGSGPGSGGGASGPIAPFDAERCADADAGALTQALAGSIARLRAYEMELASRLLQALNAVPGITILGDPDPARAAARVPTVAFTMAGHPAAAVVDHLNARGIQSRDGHMYAPRLLRAAGFDPDAGVTRVSLCHYNTDEEIARFASALSRLSL